jgi:membrane protein YdbS with pleckstrin-like domain
MSDPESGAASEPGSQPADVRLRAPLQRVSPKARWMWTCSDLLRCVPPMALILLVTGPWHWFHLPGWCLVCIGAVLLAYGLLVPQWRYLVHRWEVTETAVYTQTGWWARERRIAPMSRVQTVDHREGAIARLFGLATVRVTTASSAGALTIEGLDQHRALDIVEDLTRMADSVPGDAT